jgi:hypothetical protein
MAWYEDLYNRQTYFDLYAEADTRLAAASAARRGCWASSPASACSTCAAAMAATRWSWAGAAAG